MFSRRLTIITGSLMLLCGMSAVSLKLYLNSLSDEPYAEALSGRYHQIAASKDNPVIRHLSESYRKAAAESAADGADSDDASSQEAGLVATKDSAASEEEASRKILSAAKSAAAGAAPIEPLDDVFSKNVLEDFWTGAYKCRLPLTLSNPMLSDPKFRQFAESVNGLWIRSDNEGYLTPYYIYFTGKHPLILADAYSEWGKNYSLSHPASRLMPSKHMTQTERLRYNRFIGMSKSLIDGVEKFLARQDHDAGLLRDMNLRLYVRSRVYNLPVLLHIHEFKSGIEPSIVYAASGINTQDDYFYDMQITHDSEGERYITFKRNDRLSFVRQLSAKEKQSLDRMMQRLQYIQCL